VLSPAGFDEIAWYVYSSLLITRKSGRGQGKSKKALSLIIYY